MLLLLAGAAALPGCGSSAVVHPRFASFAPATLRILPVSNETIHQLREVAFGGLLQRTIIGAETLDIPDLLRASVEESLLLKGYELSDDESGLPGGGGLGDHDFRKPLPPDAPALPYDAVCRASIEEWSFDRVSTARMHMVYRIELYLVPTAERLFFGRFACGFREDPGQPWADEVPLAIRRSVRAALRTLPPAPE